MKLYFNKAYQDNFNNSFVYYIDCNSIKDFDAVVKSSDYCFAAFKDGVTQSGVSVKSRRAKDCWLKSDALYLDIDDGLTIKDFYAKFKDFEFYLATSKSHQKLKHGLKVDRFHIIFPIQEISDINIHESYLKLLNNMLGKKADKNCLESSRKFTAYKDSLTWHNKGQDISKILKNMSLPKIEPKPKLKIHSSYNKLILNKLKLAYNKGWFNEYGYWLKLGMAMKTHGFQLEDWHLFCDTDKDKQQADYKWLGFKDDGVLGTDYLLNICKHI